MRAEKVKPCKRGELGKTRLGLEDQRKKAQNFEKYRLLCGGDG